jgi:hypothetical protein
MACSRRYRVSRDADRAKPPSCSSFSVAARSFPGRVDREFPACIALPSRGICAACGAFLMHTGHLMSRRYLRFSALLTLVLLGAPVAMHVVLHDLEHHEAVRALDSFDELQHGTHEHPIVSSEAPQLPRASAAPSALVTAFVTSLPRPVRRDRNVRTHGALRSDRDVGLSLLLSTFRI